MLVGPAWRRRLVALRELSGGTLTVENLRMLGPFSMSSGDTVDNG
jgi:hypothetical protein